MPNDFAGQNQWVEQNGTAVAPTVSRVYLNLDSGAVVLTDDLSERDTYVRGIDGGARLDSGSFAGAEIRKHGDAILLYFRAEPVYLNLDSGAVTVSDSSADADTYIQSASGALTMDDSGTGAATLAKRGGGFVVHD